MKIIFLIVSLLFVGDLCAQEDRFGAAAVLGINFSELEGDGIFAYAGLNAGIIGTVKFSERLQLGLEFLFSQNGEYVMPAFYPRTEYGKTKLNHLEIPLHLDFLVDFEKKKDYAEWKFEFGLAYAKLLGYRAADKDGNDLTELIVYKDNNALLAQAGLTYFFTKNLGLNLRSTLPIAEEGLSLTLTGRLVYFI